MNKKYVIIGFTCIFLLISGVCYSCGYHKGNDASVLVSAIDGKVTEKQNNKEQLNSEQNSEERNKEKNSNEQNSNEQNSNEQNIDEQIDQYDKEHSQEDLSSERISNENENTEITSKLLYVHICGAVVNPGVYQVAKGARICDLIQVSGGLKSDAAGDYINQAEQVEDGKRIYIPSKEELKELSTESYITGDQGNNNEAEKSSNETASEATSLININLASAKELMELPGIGQAKADSIIEYRKTNGDFNAIEDLMKIHGIKEGLFQQISSYVTVN